MSFKLITYVSIVINHSTMQRTYSGRVMDCIPHQQRKQAQSTPVVNDVLISNYHRIKFALRIYTSILQDRTLNCTKKNIGKTISMNTQRLTRKFGSKFRRKGTWIVCQESKAWVVFIHTTQKSLLLVLLWLLLLILNVRLRLLSHLIENFFVPSCYRWQLQYVQK